MKFYQELTLLPDAEIDLAFLWAKIYQQIHLALVENKLGNNKSLIAVAFPEYGSPGFLLGRKIRLFSPDKKRLEQLDIYHWLNRLSDYVHIKSIQPVPEYTTSVCYLREHVKGKSRIQKEMHNKALLWIKKSGGTYESCLAELEKTRPDHNSKLPFIWMESQQTKQQNESTQKFPLFIKQIFINPSQQNEFTCYGLSLSQSRQDLLSTVPYF